MPRRAILVAAVSVAALAVALGLRARDKATVFATPAECLAAFRDANLDCDAARYRNCLGGTLRTETDRDYPENAKLALALRESQQGVKHWVESAAQSSGDRAAAAVDEVRITGQRRMYIELARSEKGWLITQIKRGDEKPASIRYGTPSGDFQQGRDDDD